MVLKKDKITNLSNDHTPYIQSEYDRILQSNGRVKKVLITASNGEEKTVILSDKFEEQSIPVSFSQSFTWLKLTILEVYPGLKYKDTCISSVTFEQENQ